MIRQTNAGHWVIDGDTHISKWVEEKGALQHDYQTLPIILEYIKEGDVVVDAGANIGDTTGPFLDKVGPGGEVYAFEPHPEAFVCLKRNCPKANVIDMGLGATEGEAFIRPTAESPLNIGASYVDWNKEGTAFIDALDSFTLKQCNFIKIDVEGSEYEVLRGAQNTIHDFRPRMAIELNQNALGRQGSSIIDVLVWLDWMGYQVFPISCPDRNHALPQYDILALPK